MDETGVFSRAMKAREKTIVFSKGCTTKAACREERDLDHESLVATIKCEDNDYNRFLWSQIRWQSRIRSCNC
jgi:hypothetical protein